MTVAVAALATFAGVPDQGTRNGADSASDDGALDRITGHGRADRGTTKAAYCSAFFRLRARAQRHRQYQNGHDFLHFSSSHRGIAIAPPSA
jgi:hypothetical protein